MGDLFLIWAKVCFLAKTVGHEQKEKVMCMRIRGDMHVTSFRIHSKHKIDIEI